MQNELDIVRDVSARLEQGGLAYMLTGSMAMTTTARREEPRRHWLRHELHRALDG
jgi:hypothetical protein